MTSNQGRTRTAKPAKSDERQARLAKELRANLLKRKAQAKARALPKDRDEGRQS
jgi:hypothetical protein